MIRFYDLEHEAWAVEPDSVPVSLAYTHARFKDGIAVVGNILSFEFFQRRKAQQPQQSRPTEGESATPTEPGASWNGSPLVPKP